VAITIDKARGCLLGQAVGNALGAPVEGLSRSYILRTYGPVQDYIDGQQRAAARGRYRLPGLYTGDTQQALVIADVLVENRYFDPEAARQKYIELSQPCPGLPRGALRDSPASALRAALQPAAPGRTNQTGFPLADNAAAMRIAPLGLYYAGESTRLRQAAVQASRQTHSDSRAIAAAVAVACLVAHLAVHTVGSPDEERAALRAAATAAMEAEIALANGHEPAPPRFSSTLLLLDPLWEAPTWEVLRTIVIQANRQQPPHPITSPSDSFACASVPTAIYLALHLPNFEQAVTSAVNLGGDADTVGAISGALAGARWGASNIPQRWLDGLANTEGILARADALAGGASKGSIQPESLLSAERRLSLAQQRAKEAW